MGSEEKSAGSGAARASTKTTSGKSKTEIRLAVRQGINCMVKVLGEIGCRDYGDGTRRNIVHNKGGYRTMVSQNEIR